MSNLLFSTASFPTVCGQRGQLSALAKLHHHIHKVLILEGLTQTHYLGTFSVEVEEVLAIMNVQCVRTDETPKC